MIHKTLISKMQHYGFRGAAKNLFGSLLENRHQYVSLNNTQSNTKPNNCRVPQGSVFGPLVFTLFFNDIGNCSFCNPRLFANDTCFIHK